MYLVLINFHCKLLEDKNEINQLKKIDIYQDCYERKKLIDIYKEASK